MPKKLPLYWPNDANCNKLSSKTLRVLRDRPNKLNSGPRTIQTLCDSYKNKHFKTEKKDKFRPVEEFRGFLSSETILSRHSKKPRPRQILQSNKSQGSKALQNLNLNSAWKKKYSDRMAVDFDHMYIDCGDSKISIGRDIEFQHLKELNLLHLDLIQQQAEQLISKDKIIKALKEENKNLRARLERIDRRVSLSLQKKSNELSPISVQTDFSNDVSFPFSVKSEGSPKTPGQKSPSARSPALKNFYEKSPQLKVLREEALVQTDSQLTKRDSLRKLSPRQVISNQSISPVPQVIRVSPREKRAKKDVTQSATEVPLTTNLGNQLLSPLSPSTCDNNRKTRSPTNKRTLIEEVVVVPQKKNKNVESEEKEKASLSPFEDEGITNHSLRSRNKSKDSHEEPLQNLVTKTIETATPSIQTIQDSSQHSDEKQNSNIPTISSSISTDSEKWKHSFKAGVETRKIRGKGILTTNESYYLPSHSSVDFLEVSGNEEQTQVEIPKWRIKVLTSLYVMEGTENLEDEIFIKRHAKPEQDERRRKRWDLQRMREQRQYEKLRERYEGRNNPNGCSSGNQQSLWPKPESAQSLQIDSYLPVCAFGQPLAQISESDFFVPWLTGKAPLQVGLSTRRKKR